MAFGTPVVGTLAYSVSGGTTVAPSYPAGMTATDQVVLIIGAKAQTAAPNIGSVTTPSGFTARGSALAKGGYGTTNGTDTGNTDLRFFTQDTVTGSESGALTVTIADSNVAWAALIRVPTGGGAITYDLVTGEDTSAGNVSAALGSTLFDAGDLALWAMSIPTDVSTPAQFSAHAISATGATFATPAELAEPDTTVGSDIGGFIAWTTCSTGPSSAAPTVTATAGGTTTNVRGPVVLLRLREAASAVSTLAAAGLNAAGQALTSVAETISTLGAATLALGGQALASQNGTTSALGASTIAQGGQVLATIRAVVSPLSPAGLGAGGQALATTMATSSALSPAVIGAAGQAAASIAATVSALGSAAIGAAGQALGTMAETVSRMTAAVVRLAGQAIDGAGSGGGIPPVMPPATPYGIYYGY